MSVINLAFVEIISSTQKSFVEVIPINCSITFIKTASNSRQCNKMLNRTAQSQILMLIPGYIASGKKKCHFIFACNSTKC